MNNFKLEKNIKEKENTISLSLPILFSDNEQEIKAFNKFNWIFKTYLKSIDFYNTFIEGKLRNSIIDREINFLFLEYIVFQRDFLKNYFGEPLVEKDLFFQFKKNKDFNLNDFNNEFKKAMNSFIQEKSFFDQDKIVSINFIFRDKNKKSSISVFFTKNFKLKTSISNNSKLLKEKELKKALNKFYLLTDFLNEENKKIDYIKPTFKIFYCQKRNVFEMVDKIIIESFIGEI